MVQDGCEGLAKEGLFVRRWLLSVLCFVLAVWAGFVCSAGDGSIGLARLSDSVWVHTSFYNYDGNRVPSNGVIVLTGAGLVLIDTPWTPGQTRELLEAAERQFGRKVVLALVTHAHQDRIGGMDVLIENGVKVLSTPMTCELAGKAGYPKPQPVLDPGSQTLTVGRTVIEVYYPGPSHTLDNVVVYLPGDRVLFGGCVVKAAGATNLGNLEDGDPQQYPAAVGRLMERYPDASFVVPGHGAWGGLELLTHTLELAEEAQAQK